MPEPGRPGRASRATCNSGFDLTIFATSGESVLARGEMQTTGQTTQLVFNGEVAHSPSFATARWSVSEISGATPTPSKPPGCGSRSIRALEGGRDHILVRRGGSLHAHRMSVRSGANPGTRELLVDVGAKHATCLGT